VRKPARTTRCPCTTPLEAYLDEYVRAAGISEDKKGPLFRAALTKNGGLSEDYFPQGKRWWLRLHEKGGKHHEMRVHHTLEEYLDEYVQAAGIATQIGCHTFRATGITIYLTNGGTLEKAQMMAAHSSPRTTKLYDRTSDVVSLDEVERVVF
jgi:integrase